MWIFLLNLILGGDFLKADPNNRNQCGQYNAYMGNLCDWDKNQDQKKYPTDLSVCADCHSSQVQLNDITKPQSIRPPESADEEIDRSGTK